MNRQQLEHKAKAKRELELRQQIYPLNYFEPMEHQQPFHTSVKKVKGIFGGNRSGKTLNGASYVVKKLKTQPNFQARASTWADMAIPIQQTVVHKLLPKDGSATYRFSEKDGFYRNLITFDNGSVLRFKTYEQKAKTYQGADLDLEWDDEEPPEDIVKEQKARLIDRNGELIRTMTPLNGITYTYDEMIENEIGDEEVEYWYWATADNTYIDQGAAERILGGYAEREREARSEGHFLNLTTGNSYYAFSDDNIIDSFDYMKNRPLEISCDFNVDLMCWNIGQEKQGKDYVFDFVEVVNEANTDYLCQVLKNQYPQHQGGWYFYGDISGNKRDPAASRTNWAIIREHFPGASIDYQNIRNIKDRVDSFNGRIKNSTGIYWYVTKNCKRLIKDLRQVTWEHLLNKGKAGMMTHASDGESYKLFWKYPLTGKIRSKQW